MATFEGPLLATKSLNKIGHYTDWVIGHVHLGALGWNGFMAFGVVYYLVPIITCVGFGTGCFTSAFLGSDYSTAASPEG
ncbi:hypothetical protein HX13_22900 [Chryseobacterium sp. P1-3]|nr:hypothetical protein HX13_22900 [Chryseobacterium sp. P1-3]